MRRRQPKAIRIVAAGAVLLSALAACCAPRASLPHGGIVVALLALVGLVAGEHLDVTVPLARGKVWRFAGAEVALAACLLYLPGPRLWGVAFLAGLVVLAISRHEGRSGRTVEYAVAAFVASTGLAALVVGVLLATGAGRALAAGVAILGAALLRHCLAAVAVALTSRRPLLPLVRRRLFGSGVFALGNGAIGVLAAVLASTEPLGLTGLVVPVVLVVSSYEQQVRRAAQASLYAELARAQERAGARSVDASAGIVSTVAARMLGGADIEMLLQGADGLVHYRGDESGLRDRRRTDPGALDAPWVLRLLASGGVRIARDVGRPECGVCIGPASRPVALLSARRPVGAPAFTRREAAVLRALAGQAEPWLAGAVDAHAAEADARDGDADGAAEVREAARRVITTADRPRLDADDLVAELHGLERAVAQLVGSSTHESADAVEADGALPSARRSTDWTTTGRLPAERPA